MIVPKQYSKPGKLPLLIFFIDRGHKNHKTAQHIGSSTSDVARLSILEGRTFVSCTQWAMGPPFGKNEVVQMKNPLYYLERRENVQ